MRRHFEKFRSRYKSSPQATAGASPTPSSTENLRSSTQLATKPSLSSSSKDVLAPAPVNSADTTPPEQPVTGITVVAPTKVHTINESVAGLLDTVAPEPAHSTSSALKNTALRKAIEKHTANLSEQEKRSCLKAFGAISESQLLQRIKSYDQDHAGASNFRQHADKVEGVLGVLDKFLKIASPNVSASPEATIAVGAIRAVLDVALNFLGFFGKLTSMICRFGDFLAPLVEYSKIPQDYKTLVDSLSAVYGDFLVFCQKAHTVFVDERGRTRKMTAFRVFWRVQWVPFETEFGTIEDDLRHHLQVLQQSSSAIAVTATLDVLAQQRAQVKEDLLSWLSDFPYEQRHEERYAKKHPGTGDWLIQHDKFQSWVQSPSSTVLWVYGGPGTGKSFLAANVLEHITSKKALDEDAGIAFVYYDHQVAAQQDRNHAVRAMLKQLCRTRKVAPEHLLQAKQKALPVGSAEDLKAIAGLYRELFIVVDALDECAQGNRPEMVDLLREISQYLPLVRIFVTSRPETDIIRVMEDAGTPTLQVDASFMAPDIRRFVTDEVRDLRIGRNGVRLCIKSDDVADEVVRTLTERADGMFLWVRLQLQNLCQVSEARKDGLVRQALSTLPKGLHDTYARISDQIMEKPEYLRSLAIRTLQWVMYARRPLYTVELMFALATMEEDQNAIDAELDDLDVVLGACSSLVVQQFSEHGSFVRPTHYSVQEYFTGSDRPLHEPIFQLPFGDSVQAHKALSIVCLAHLCQPAMFSGKLYHQSGFALTQDPFLHYAATYFDTHLFATAPETAYPLIERFLESDPEVFRSILSTRAVEAVGLNGWLMDWKPCRALQLDWEEFALAVPTWHASSLVAATNLRLSCFPDIHHKYSSQEGMDIALQYACRRKHDWEVHQLIAEGADIECRDSDGRTPLCLAVLNNHAESAMALLENGASVNAQDYEGNSVLQMAVMRMTSDFICSLLESGADISYVGGYYGTALQAAAAGIERDGLVELLIERGADLNVRGGRHPTALMAAALTNSLTTACQLVTAGADIHAVEEGVGSALHIASRYGYNKLVNYLLDEGADIDLAGDTFSSPLIAAMEGNDKDEYRSGTYETFMILIGRGARVDVQALVVAAEMYRVRQMVSILERLDDGPSYSAIDIGVALVAVWKHENHLLDAGERKAAWLITRLLKMRLSPSENGMVAAVGPDAASFTFSMGIDTEWETDEAIEGEAHSSGEEHDDVLEQRRRKNWLRALRHKGQRRRRKYGRPGYIYFSLGVRNGIEDTVSVEVDNIKIHKPGRHPKRRRRRLGLGFWRRRCVRSGD